MKILRTSIQYLKGVGEKRASTLSKLGVLEYIHLLLHIPLNYIDRTKFSNIQNLRNGDIATLPVEVISIQSGLGGRWRSSMPLKIYTMYENTALELIYFAGQEYVHKQFKVGAKMVVSGKIKVNFPQGFEMHHPHYAVPIKEKNVVLKIEPIYPLTAGLTSKYLSNIINNILTKIQIFENNLEWLDKHFLQQNNWPAWLDAMQLMHMPKSENFHLLNPARERLAFDEVLAHILRMKMLKKKYRATQSKGERKPLSAEEAVSSSPLIQQCIKLLPFELTEAQKRVLQEICADLGGQYIMQRLVQGDVGSGKTIVAFLASLFVVEQGGQAAIVAPTEVLAKQHYKNLQPLAQQLGLRTALLISAIPNSSKKLLKESLKKGEIDILIGTHAILQNTVEFKNLKLATFDEQHKFGVAQRAELLGRGSKDCGVHYLMMSATPIPRTLSLVSYADKDLSILNEKPKNRREIKTISLSSKKMRELISKLGKFIERGEKVFWLCPLVEESEELDLTAVRERFDSLHNAYPGKVGLVHGRMKPQQKDEMMTKLIEGEINILVATTVIEVGVDVPDATLMIIENCERYGLSQLHQLRGRIGRGTLDATCILMHSSHIGGIARGRISVMKESSDGFFIANEDLRLRGQGDLVGLKQSGVPNFKVYNLLEDNKILHKALEFAKLVDQNNEYEKYEEMAHLYKWG